MIAVLLSLLIKSSLVAGMALSAVWLLAGRTPAERVTLLRAAVVLLAALPLIALAGPDLTIWLAAAPPAATPVATTAEAFILPASGRAAVAPTFTLPALSSWIALGWALGAAGLLARFGLGVLTLARWTRSSEVVSDAAWTAPLARLAGKSAPRLLATRRLAAPLSWGVPPGVVLIGAAQLQQPRDAEAVLAHELAHIRRHDWLFLALSQVATALLWFNPLVWLLQAEVGRLSEEAADAEALRHVEPEAYARTLLGIAADFTPTAATGMTGPARSLAKRITKVMTQRRPASPRPLAMMVTVGALLAVATPLAAIELSVRDEQIAPLPPLPPVPPLPPAAPPAPPLTGAEFGAPPAPPQVPAPPAPPAPPAAPEAPQRGDGYGSWIHRSERPLSDAQRAASAAARHSAVHARAVAHEARAHAAQARTLVRANTDIARHAERTAVHARSAAEHAAQARAHAEQARTQAARQMAEARVQMRAGADQMDEGALNMREEARKLRDPAYRARQIERARERGQTVTDQELLDTIPRMEEGADRMVEAAARMRNEGSDPA